MSRISHATLGLIAAVLLSTTGCDGKSAAAGPAKTEATTATPSKAKEQPKPGATEAKAPPKDDGPSASNDKDFLGLDLKPIGAWKPAWDADAKVAKWENEDSMASIVVRVVTDKLDSVDDLKEAAPMMMQLGSAITKVDEEKKTDKGWYAIVTREPGSSDLVYVRRFGASTVVCSGNIAKSDLGASLTKPEVVQACESLALKR
jgi:hypothetical protein